MRKLGAVSLFYSTMLVRRAAVVLAVYGAMVVGVLHGRTAEPAREFLDKLRERKYYDHAEDYLERLPQNPLATDEIKQVVPFEAALTLWAEAGTLQDVIAREQKLNAAQQKLNEFLKANPEHALAGDAQTQLASISVERGSLLVQRADRSPNEKDKLLDEARQMLGQAEKIYTAAYEQTRTQLKQIQADAAAGKDNTTKRDELRRDWVQSRLKLADISYQKSKASIAGTADQKRYLEDAAEKYASLGEDFENKLVGLQARVLEGICYQDLGDRTKAMSAYDAVLTIPEETDKDVRAVKTRALRQALECWVKDAKYEDALTRAAPWLSKSRATEETEPDWLAAKYLLAKAIERQIAAGVAATSQRAEKLAQARRLAQDVARVRGEFQGEAATLLAQLGKAGVDADAKQEKEKDKPGSFEEAADKANAALDEISGLSLQISLAESSRDPEQLKQVPEWKKQVADKQAAAVQTVRNALALAKPDSPGKDVNRLRYTLAYFLFNQGEFYDAAVIAEYVARRFDEFELAPACGEIALKSYVRLYQTSPEDKSKREFEANHISSMADYLMTTWPGESVAQEAINWFLYLAVDRQQLDKAATLLDKLPAESPARAEAQIRIGRMLWSEYLKASRLKEERPPQAELDKRMAQAQSTLEAGVKTAMARDSITPGIVDGVHALAQIYLDSSQPAKAIELLEDSKVGPLKLANDGHPATQREGIPFEIYRSALRAYITADPPRIDDALKIMDRLDAAAGNDPKASENLVQVYIAMGRDLQQQLKSLQDRKDTAGLKAVSQAVEAFLKRAAARDQGNNFNTLNWMANTFYSLGMGFDSGDGEPTPQSKAYYKQAVQAYEKILDAVAKNPQFAPTPEAVLAAKVRLAISRRGLGEADQLKQAVAALNEILQDNPKMLEVQVEAAKTYQAWGEHDAQYFKTAILGTNRDVKTRENSVWGWAKIAGTLHQVLPRPSLTEEQRNRYRDTFFEARYQLSVCRYRHALAEKDAKEKKGQLDATKSDIATTYKLYPDLGGDEWKPKYEALLKQVQKDLGEKPDGLAGLDAEKKS